MSLNLISSVKLVLKSCDKKEMKNKCLSCDWWQSMKTCLWRSKLTMPRPVPPDNFLKNWISPNVRDVLLYHGHSHRWYSGKSLSFLDLGDPSSSVLVEEKTELLSYYRGIAPTPLCRSPSSATLLAGWGMGSNGAQQDKGGWGGGVCVEGGPVTDPSHFPSIRKRLALFEHVFRRPLSHHAFRWQHWQLRLKTWMQRKRRGQTLP